MVPALQPTVTDAAIVVLLYTLAARRPRRESLAGLALCLAGSGIAIYGWTFAHSSAGLLLLAVVALGATFTAAWVLGDSAAYRRAHYLSLEERLASAERTADLERTRAQAVEESAARLRRIERDLHDGAQVRLTALAMTLGEVKETVSGQAAPAEVVALATQAHQMAKDTLAELRDLARAFTRRRSQTRLRGQQVLIPPPVNAPRHSYGSGRQRQHVGGPPSSYCRGQGNPKERP